MACRSAREMAKGGKANWMKDAVKPSRKGVFSAKAKAAGKSTAAFAREKKSAPGKLGKEARLALTFAKERPMKKAMGGKAHDDTQQDMALVKKMVKPSAMKGPMKKAVGGAAKIRLGQSTPAGKQKAPPRQARRGMI